MRKLFVLALLTVSLLVGCDGSPNPYAITRQNPAFLRDDIFSVEPRANGTTIVWMVHDDVGAYCVTEQALSDKIMAWLQDPEKTPTVLVSYISVNPADKSDPRFQAGGGCYEAGMYGSSKDLPTVTMYHVTDIHRLGGD